MESNYKQVMGYDIYLSTVEKVAYNVNVNIFSNTSVLNRDLLEQYRSSYNFSTELNKVYYNHNTRAVSLYY